MIPGKRKITFCSLILHSLRIASLILAIAACVPAQTLSFRTIFGSNMVLPHDRSLTLSGYAAPDTALKLEVNGTQYSLRSDAAGKWQTEIAPLPAGGPYQIRLRNSNGEEVVLDHILAGNVWLCSGQSNMAYPVAASIDQPDAYNQGHPAIRLFTVPQLAELTSLEEFREAPGWQLATNESVKNFSAVCYFTGRQMLGACPRIRMCRVPSAAWADARRRDAGDAGASSRSANAADAHAPPEPFGRKGIAGQYLRCSSSTMSPHRLLLAP